MGPCLPYSLFGRNLRTLSYFVAIAAVAIPAVAQKQTGVLEGTLVDQENRPVRGITVDVNRTDYEDPSPLRRFLLRTDKLGHFVCRVPVGAYTMKVATPQGRLLKEISDVRVDAGKVQSLNSTLAGLPVTGSPLTASKKGKQPLQPTQPDIMRGCITVRGIVFQKARLLLLNSNVGVSGRITNDCGRDAYVSIFADFFNATGDKIAGEIAEKLVPATGAGFQAGPDPRSSGAVNASIGRVTEVYVKFQSSQ